MHVFNEVLVLKGDRFSAHALAQVVLREFPAVRCNILHSLAEAARVLAANPADLLLTGLGFADGDAIDFLAGFDRHCRPFRKILAVTRRSEVNQHLILRSLPVDGVFDSCAEGPEQLAQALRDLAAGRQYWSPTAALRLGTQRVSRMLSERARLILSVIGDGTDDRTAAEVLGMTPASVQSARRMLHRKLGIQHRGQLFCWAMQHGFIQITPDGVRRPGLALLKVRQAPAEPPAVLNSL